MRFASTFLLACSAALASAQVYFTMSSLPDSIEPGTNYDVTWLSGGGTNTYSVFLVQGPNSNLKTLMTLGSQLSHNGSLTWSPSPSLAKGSDYAFKIVDDSNANDYNYSGQFTIVTSITGSNTASIASSTGSATTSAASGSSSTASQSSTGTASLTTLTGSSTTTRASTTGGSSTSTRASSTSASSTPSTTANVNGARTVKVGGGLLAAVAGVMIAL